MDRSDSIVNLTQALAKAQQQMVNPPALATNPRFKSRYATLAAIRDAVIPPLAQEGITLLQPVWIQGDTLVCESVLALGDEYLSTTLAYPLPDGDIQAFSTLVTYLRKIALQALLVVAGDVDDDGNLAADSDGRGNGRRGRQAAGAAPAGDTETAERLVKQYAEDMLVERYTAAGLVERINGIYAEQHVPAEHQARWWESIHRRHGADVPIAVLRQLYLRALERQHAYGASSPQNAPESTPTPAAVSTPTATPEWPHEAAAGFTLDPEALSGSEDEREF